MNTHFHKKVTALSVEHPAEVLLMQLLALSTVALILAYVYLVSLTTLNVIAGREATAKAAALESSVGVLQQDYYTLSRALSPEAAATLGLSDVAATAYVVRPASVGMARTALNAN